MKLSKRSLLSAIFNMILLICCSYQITLMLIHYLNYRITVNIESHFDSVNTPLPAITFCHQHSAKSNKPIGKIKSGYDIRKILQHCCITSMSSNYKNCDIDCTSNAAEIVNSEYYCLSIDFQKYSKKTYFKIILSFLNYRNEV